MRLLLRISLRPKQRKRIKLLWMGRRVSLGEVFLPFALGLQVVIGDVEGDGSAWWGRMVG